jgi:hypothetical protein
MQTPPVLEERPASVKNSGGIAREALLYALGQFVINLKNGSSDELQTAIEQLADTILQSRERG